MIHSSIFRAYDIRGVVGETLTPDTVFAIGQALASYALEQGETTLAIARDGRLSGPELQKALADGILATGCHVIDIGMVPTPLLYYATFLGETRSGVMLTGSHNPPNYNGLKMVVQGQTLCEKEIQHLYQRILQKDFAKGVGQLRQHNILPRYLDEIKNNIQLSRPLKVVVDCGNGVAGMMAPQLFQQLGCEVIPLFCEVDGHFPNHHPDPSHADNLKDLIQAVLSHRADIGFAFDGDGDRLGVVTSAGEIIWADRQLILFAQALLKKNPGATIIYDVKCTTYLDKLIRAWGGQPLMWKTGHSLIKAKLAETKALLAGEMSGHLFFNDRWFGFDDALYASVRLLEILSDTALDSAALFQTIPNSVNTPELKLAVLEEEKFSVMQSIIQQSSFDPDKLITLDGLRVNFDNGWGLIRPSNTTPYLILRFEADCEKTLHDIQSAFRQLLLSVNPQFVLPF